MKKKVRSAKKPVKQETLDIVDGNGRYLSISFYQMHFINTIYQKPIKFASSSAFLRSCKPTSFLNLPALFPLNKVI